MITDFSRYTQRRNWQLGESDYSSPLLVGSAELASFREQLERAISQTEFAKIIPSEKTNPDGHREALEIVIPQFVKKYSEATSLIICDIMLTPENGAPSVEETYGVIAGTPKGILQIQAVTAFFLMLATNKSETELLSLLNGEDIAPPSTPNPSKTIARSNTKNGSLSHPSRARVRSKNTAKRLP